MNWIWNILVSIWNALKTNSYVATVEVDDEGVAIEGAVVTIGALEEVTDADGTAEVEFKSKAGVAMDYTVSAAGYTTVTGSLVTTK